MGALVVSPPWFHGADIVLEFFTMLVALGVVYAGWHAYKVTRQRNYLAFASAFSLLAVTFAMRLFAAATMTIESFREQIVQPTAASIGLGGAPTMGLQLFFIGRLFYVWLVLAAYAILLALALKWRRKREAGVLIALTTVIAAASLNVSWWFHLAALALLFCIALQHFMNYQERKSPMAYSIFAAFALLALEPALYMLSVFLPDLVAAAFGVRLIAYCVILVTLWKVLRDE